MVRCSTGHRLFSAGCELTSWLSDVMSPAHDLDNNTTLLKRSTTALDIAFEMPRPPQEVETGQLPSMEYGIMQPPQPEDQIVLGVDARSLVRACVAVWKEQCLAATSQGAADNASRQAFSTWFLAAGANEPLLRISLCEWLKVAVSTRTLRAMTFCQQRASFSVDGQLIRESSSASNSRPRMQAFGALFSATEKPLVRRCFHVWLSDSKEMRRRTVLVRWLVERRALSQRDLVLQAAVRSWHHYTLQSWRPTWALDLERDVTTLLRKQRFVVQEDEPSSAEDGAPAAQQQSSVLARQIALPTVVLVMLVACVVAHMLLLACCTGAWSSVPLLKGISNPAGAAISVDSDGDGVADSADRCPYTPTHHRFRSTWQSDWDRDGCFDITEDLDDDNDGIPDLHDRCPQTLLSDGVVDSCGCSVPQRQLFGGTDTKSSSDSSINIGRLHDILLEVTVGGVFTAALDYAWRYGMRTLRLW